jgi:hypothetical protein
MWKPGVYTKGLKQIFHKSSGRYCSRTITKDILPGSSTRTIAANLLRILLCLDSSEDTEHLAEGLACWQDCCGVHDVGENLMSPTVAPMEQYGVIYALGVRTAMALAGVFLLPGAK